MKSLDVIVPTYNGSLGIGRMLDSLLVAAKPAGLDWAVTIVDNNSTDDTAAIVRNYFPRFAGRLHLVQESHRGRSHALNKGIESTGGDVLAYIDDDETVDAEWVMRIVANFADPAVGYLGGPYVPVWPDDSQPPRWMPNNRQGVLGTTYDPNIGLEVIPFGSGYNGTLMGGNSALRRSVVSRVGKYNVELGRTDKRLLSCEDHDYQLRLQADGCHGVFDPRMKIFHWLKKERIAKAYFRSWSFWRSYSLAVMEAGDTNITKVFGIPRWQIGQALRRLPYLASSNEAERFESELLWWDLAGYVYSRWGRLLG